MNCKNKINNNVKIYDVRLGWLLKLKSLIGNYYLDSKLLLLIIEEHI